MIRYILLAIFQHPYVNVSNPVIQLELMIFLWLHAVGTQEFMKTKFQNKHTGHLRQRVVLVVATAVKELKERNVLTSVHETFPFWLEIQKAYPHALNEIK